MLRAYLPQANINEDLTYGTKVRPIGGYPIGLLAVDGLHGPIIPGSVHSASTWDFPVLMKLVKETANWKVLNSKAEGDEYSPRVRDDLIAGAKELERLGVRAITGGCGFLINFQKDVAAAVDVPVFLSSLSQLPMLRHGIKPGQKIGIITGASDCLVPKCFEQIDIYDLSDVIIIGCQECDEFKNMRTTTQAGRYNPYKVERDLANLATEFVAANPEIGVLLLECSVLPAFAWAIQNAVNLPVFDYYTLVEWMYMSVVRKQFGGIY